MNQPGPLLSIITVVLNDKPGLLKTLKSIQDQIGLDYEHIIVDGGSTDGSAEIASAASTVHIPSIADGGIYQGMQRGAAAASGKYLLFCNSGDLIFGFDFLQLALKDLENDKRDYKWGFGPIIESTLRENYSWVACEGDANIETISSRKTFVPFPSFIVSRKLFEKIGGFTFNYKIAGDFELIVRCAREEFPLRWNDPIALFYAGGISYNRADLAWSEEHKIRKHLLNLNLINRLESRTRFLIRILKWKIGKLLDLIQRSGLFGITNWRDRRSVQVPNKYQKLLSK